MVRGRGRPGTGLRPGYPALNTCSEDKFRVCNNFFRCECNGNNPPTGRLPALSVRADRDAAAVRPCPRRDAGRGGTGLPRPRPRRRSGAGRGRAADPVAADRRGRTRSRDAGHERRDADDFRRRPARRPLHPVHRRRNRPRAEHRARGAVSVRGHLLHPVRGRGVPPHHLVSRPARRDGAVPRRDRVVDAGAAVERQPRGGRARACRMARPLAQARLSVRAGRGRA